MTKPALSWCLTAVLVLTITSTEVQSDLPPLPGKFEGVYRRDPWGVGRFSYFLVDPKLHEQFVPFEGTPIRVDVTDLYPAVNPGEVVISRVVKIERLPEPDVHITWRMIPEKPAPNQPFQVVAWVENAGKRSFSMSGYLTTHVTIRMPKPVANPDGVNPLAVGYTNGQLSTETIHDALDRRRAHERGQKYRDTFTCTPTTVEPGGRYPVMLRVSEGLPAGRYELAVVSTDLPNRHLVVGLTKSVVIPADAKPAPHTPALRMTEHNVTQDGDDYRAIVRLVPADRARVVRVIGLVTERPGGVTEWAAQVSASTAEGTPVALDWRQRVNHPRYPGTWRVSAVPADGVVVSKTFRRESRFDPTAIRKLSLGILTADGMEEFDISAEFTDSPVPEVPFGPEVGGVKIRLRPVKDVFTAEEKVQFHFQAINTRGKPVVWKANHYKPGSNITFEVNGRPIPPAPDKPEGTGGWVIQHLCSTPYELTFTLPDGVVPATKGKHKLIYRVVSNPGDYRNTVGQPIPFLDGTLVSNEVAFEIR